MKKNIWCEQWFDGAHHFPRSIPSEVEGLLKSIHQGRFFHYSIMIIAVLGLSLAGITKVQAGTKDLIGGKKIRYEDDNARSLRDSFGQREEEVRLYRDKMLANSDESKRLLKEIRDLLRMLNRRLAEEKSLNLLKVMKK